MMEPDKYLTPAQLVSRWAGEVAYMTLAQWRSRKRGPAFVKLGGKILYAIADVEAYEKASRHKAGAPE